MLKAARFGDQISHTQQRSGLITGMIVGALIVGAVVLAVASGGTAIPALIAVGAVLTGAAVGGGIGRLIGGEMTVPKGAINKSATTVFINGILAARSCIDTALCQDHTLQLIATGSVSVFIEKFPAARVSDTGACSYKISQGSPNVFIADATGACAGVTITPEVEPWLENLHRVIGWAGGLCLLGPVYGLRIAVASLIGGEIGAHFGGQIGQAIGGKWGGVIGSILGGVIGGGIPLNPRVGSFINRLYVKPNTLGMNGGNIGLRPNTQPPPTRTPIPGDSDFIGPVQSGSWRLTPNGAGAHMVERANVRGRTGLQVFDEADTPRFYPNGTPENAGQAHIRLHEATRNEGIRLRGGNSNLTDQQLLDAYRRAYSNPNLNGIQGSLRTPNSSVNLGDNLTPSQAFDRLMQWRASQPPPAPPPVP